jgi:hypothetical protein
MIVRASVHLAYRPPQMTVGHSAFFYGTLMHPKILKRVIANDGSHLQLCPAVLLVSLVHVSLNHPLLLIWHLPVPMDLGIYPS